MSHLLTWHFDRPEQAANVQDALRAAGIPIENYRIEPDLKQVRIIAPATTLPGILEVLRLHGLVEVG